MGAIHNAEWRDISTCARESAKDCQGSDPDKLMHDAIARHKSAIINLYIAGEQSASGYDRVIANLAVMSNVRMVHEEVIVTDDGRAAFFGAAMDLAVFANDVAVTDL